MPVKFKDIVVLDKAYNPDQPRDEKGRWGSGGSYSNAVTSGSAKIKETGKTAFGTEYAHLVDGSSISVANNGSWNHTTQKKSGEKIHGRGKNAKDLASHMSDMYPHTRVAPTVLSSRKSTEATNMTKVLPGDLVRDNLRDAVTKRVLRVDGNTLYTDGGELLLDKCVLVKHGPAHAIAPLVKVSPNAMVGLSSGRFDKVYNPDQPRDGKGRWGEGGSTTGSGKNAVDHLAAHIVDKLKDHPDAKHDRDSGHGEGPKSNVSPHDVARSNGFRETSRHGNYATYEHPSQDTSLEVTGESWEHFNSGETTSGHGGKSLSEHLASVNDYME